MPISALPQFSTQRIKKKKMKIKFHCSHHTYQIVLQDRVKGDSTSLHFKNEVKEKDRSSDSNQKPKVINLMLTG